MAPSQVREPTSFGKRKENHSIIITRNGKSRQFLISPLLVSLIFGFVAMFSVGYFTATTYLVLRDDLISARNARHVRMRFEYEDRIAALRANLDKITARQLLDQQAIESRVEELIQRQIKLGANQPSLTPVINKAKALGLEIETPGVDPDTTGSIQSEKQALFNDPFDNGFALRGVGEQQNLALSRQFFEQIEEQSIPQATKDQTTKTASLSLDGFNYHASEELFSSIDQSMEEIDHIQKAQILDIRKSADTKISQIAGLMKTVGINIKPANYEKSGTQMGGPFVPLDLNANFGAHLEALDLTLAALMNAQEKINLIPVKNPAPGKKISSRYGTRIDPFHKRYAMHSGYDFKARRGEPVFATANGKVIFAGRKGGYGKLVEIRHSNGLTTRYAHLSKILVKTGQKIKSGSKIGKVGSTGRSTGPHLHYEIRLNDKPINPTKYLRVGRKLTKLL